MSGAGARRPVVSPEGMAAMMKTLLRRGAGTFSILLALGLSLLSPGGAVAGTDWIRHELPEGAVIEVPSEFRVLSGEVVKGIASQAARSLDRQGGRDPQRRLFVANAGEPSWAVVRLSVFDSSPADREDFLAATEDDLREIREHYRETLPRSLGKIHAKVKEVDMPRMMTVAGHPALLISYTRSSLYVGSDWKVRMHLIETGRKRFLLTISNDLTQAGRMEPVLSRILETVEFR